MESTPPSTAAEASAALLDAEAARATLAGRIVTPSWFFASMGVAIAVQIATTAAGLGDGAPWLVVAGLAVFAAVAGVQLARFRRVNGVWLGGFASRVVLGTATAASVVLRRRARRGDLGGVRRPLVARGAVVGGGRRGVRAQRPPVDAQYRGDPAAHARGESLAWLALVDGGRGRRPGAARAQRLMADLDEHVVAPARLKLMTTLTAVSEAEFATVREALDVSDSVLSKHLGALEEVGYVRRHKGVHRGRRTTWISLTPRGRKALSAHVTALRALIDGIPT